MANRKKKIADAIKRFKEHRAKQTPKKGVKKPEHKKETSTPTSGVPQKHSEVAYGPKGGQYTQSSSGKKHYVGKKGPVGHSKELRTRSAREKQKEKLSRRRERAIKKSLEAYVEDKIDQFIQWFIGESKTKKGEKENA